MKNNVKLLAALFMLLVTTVMIVVITTSFIEPVHYCNWEDCNYQGKMVTVDSFESTWGCEEWTDCFLVELTHVAQPTWSYEECDAYVFAGVE